MSPKSFRVFNAWISRSVQEPSKEMIYFNLYDLDGRFINTAKQGSVFLNDKAQVMQFTGFTDRDGQEVYEGDILTDPTVHSDEQQWWPLYYDHGSYVVNDSVIWDYARFVKKPGAKHGQPIYELEDLVVEGNIYQNKDMLDDWQVQNLKEFGYELGS